MHVTVGFSLLYTRHVQYIKRTRSNAFTILKIFSREIRLCKFTVIGDLLKLERLVIHCKCFQYWFVPRGKHKRLAEIIVLVYVSPIYIILTITDNNTTLINNLFT